MDTVIEILQQTTTTWSRWLIFLIVGLLFAGIRWNEVQKKQRDELATMKKLQIALEIKKLLLEIELMELAIRAHASELINIPRIRLQEGDKTIPKSSSPLPMLWPDKMIHGLLGSFFFLLVIVLLYLITNMEEMQNDPYNYVSFTKELVISIICGAGVTMIPGNKGWEFFFYGFSLPMLLTFLMVEFKT